jgi:GNAT superfamily N-acetyltransferase
VKGVQVTDLKIGRAGASDGAGIATVYLTSTAKLGFLPRRHNGQDTWHHFATMPTRQECWIVEGQGRIAAFLAITPGWIDHLYVHPTAQSRGFGSALLKQANLILPDGFELWTFQQNKQARAFYDRHGLHITERTDGRRNEEHLPDLKYTWRPEGKNA